LFKLICIVEIFKKTKAGDGVCYILRRIFDFLVQNGIKNVVPKHLGECIEKIIVKLVSIIKDLSKKVCPLVSEKDIKTFVIVDRQPAPRKRAIMGNQARTLHGARVGGLEQSTSSLRSEYSSSLIF